jgi:hypothetical protein
MVETLRDRWGVPHTYARTREDLLFGQGYMAARDRIRNYLQKYLPAAFEVSDQEVIAQGGRPGTAKFGQVKSKLIEAHLSARPPRDLRRRSPAPRSSGPRDAWMRASPRFRGLES